MLSSAFLMFHISKCMKALLSAFVEGTATSSSVQHNLGKTWLAGFFVCLGFTFILLDFVKESLEFLAIKVETFQLLLAKPESYSVSYMTTQ